jgi:Family of unknown function (DUF5677)
MADRLHPDSEEAFQVMLSALRKHIVLLADAMDRMLADRLTDLGSVISIMFTSVRDSCGSLLLLSEHRKFRDCLVTARTIYLTIVNICFICAKGKIAADRAIRHANQKAYRDFNRELRINDNKMTIRATGIVDLDQLPELKAAMAEFTSSKGRERRAWTEENVEQQLETIDHKYGKKVSMMLLFGLTFYRHASEVAHGTLFGTLWALGTFEGQQSRDLVSYERGHLLTILLRLACCLAALISVVEREAFAKGGAEENIAAARAVLDEIIASIDFSLTSEEVR